ncbi:MAG: cupin domain-containing protein [Saprospiraceae bacterium]|nr:cupin domain-containing protein [Saprospiraceae bacterium]
MTTVNLNQLELAEFIGKENLQQHCRATFPLLGAHGTKNSATVYFELEPGNHLGRHTDSAEELLLILDGEVEINIGEEKSKAAKNTIALVPKMVPHDLVNIGSKTARVLGFFGGSNNIISTFDETWLPTNSNTVDTSQMG